MKFFVFRNSTVEPLFSAFDTKFSNYNDVLNIADDADVYVWIYLHPFKPDNHNASEEINNYSLGIDYILNNIPSSKSLIVFTLTDISIIGFETFRNPVKESIIRFNEFLYKKAGEYKNLKVLDFSSFINQYPRESVIDWKYYYMSMMAINPRLSESFRSWFNSQLDSIALKRKKCIVVDLDNTIWGGILGEDGINSLKIGGSYPGNAFSDFQSGLLELKKHGILLSVCSKNNESDVSQVWDNLPGMILRKADFVSIKINWRNKADNIKDIAEELNIGLDSFVFIDDNPTERELIKVMLPMVEVPDYPVHPYELRKFFKNLVEKYFTTYQVTSEDINKTQQYKENAERFELQKKSSSFDDYLRSLNIEITVHPADDSNINRIVQMCQKTNQFNLTTQRYVDGDIRSFIEKGSWVKCISVKDKFGDNGLTGLIIVNFDPGKKQAEINSLLMSCRILGKKIENQFISHVLNEIFNKGFNEVTATYIPTQKNIQASDFYEDIQFTLIKIQPDGTKSYLLRKEDFNYVENKTYKITQS